MDPADLLISGEAVGEFARAFPRLLAMVDEKFDVEARLSGGAVDSDRRALTRDAHRHFGAMLRAVFEFGLYDEMAGEFAWYVSAYSARGLEEAYFRKMLDGWIIAIHSAICPPASGELTRPLEWLRGRLHDTYEHVPGAGKDLSPEAEAFLNLVVEGRRRDAAEYVVSLKDTGFPPTGLFSGVIMPAMAEVGRMWQGNEIGVAEEHAATEICRYVVYRLMDSMPREARLPYRALVACVPGEDHEIGARITADYLEAKGWAVSFLGRSTPEEDLVEAAAAGRADVVVLSVTMIANLPAARDLLRRLGERVPGVKTVVGGRAALKARAVIEAHADAVVSDIDKVHSVCLSLVGENA
jgi:methanogenic corrinoid protein MtbC1